jgi:hypothetical protein
MNRADTGLMIFVILAIFFVIGSMVWRAGVIWHWW